MSINDENSVNEDWTHCVLCVSSQDNEMDAIHELSTLEGDLEDPDDESPLSFYNSAPIPERLLENFGEDTDDVKQKNKQFTGFTNLFEFTKKRWGTPYDAVDVELEYVNDKNNEDTLKYSFKTLDGNPLGWLQLTSANYPLCVFEITCENENELFDSFDAIYINGQQVAYQTHKNK